MTARTDLDAAYAALSSGISAHVQALVDARNAATAAVASAATAAALASDESYIVELTGKLKSLTDLLNASVAPAPVDAPAPVAAPVDAPVAPVAQATPAVDAPAPVAAPVAPTAPVVLAAPSTHVPSVMETMQAAVANMIKNV